MFRYLLFSLIFALSGFFGTLHAHAEKRVALVIGNSKYQSVAELTNPYNDATAMSKKLADLGFEVVEGIDLDLVGMRRTIRRFIRKLEGADVATFYYAGHGLQVNGRNYLAPIDAALKSENDLDFEAVSVNLILSAMERNTKTNLVFLDACRDNPLARNLARSMGTRSASVGRGLARMGTGVGTFVSFSTEPGNVALDGVGENSPYTGALLQYLGKPGESLSKSMVNVRRAVIGQTNGKQVPWEHSSLTGEVILKAKQVISEPATDVQLKSEIETNVGSNQIELTYWNSIQDSNNPSLFAAYLKRYPDGLFSDLAKIRAKGHNAAKQTNKPSSDNTNDMLFWNSIRNSENHAYYQAYLNRYPEGQFVEIARLKIEELKIQSLVKNKEISDKLVNKQNIEKDETVIVTHDNSEEIEHDFASLEPTVTKIPAPEREVEEVAVSRETIRLVQRQLNKLGCSVGRVDGLWGKKSRNALELFSRHSNTQLVSLEPSDGLLNDLKQKKGRVCPLTCNNGFEIKGGQCVKKNVAKSVSKTSETNITKAREGKNTKAAKQSTATDLHCFICGAKKRKYCLSKTDIEGMVWHRRNCEPI